MQHWLLQEGTTWRTLDKHGPGPRFARPMPWSDLWPLSQGWAEPPMLPYQFTAPKGAVAPPAPGPTHSESTTGRGREWRRREEATASGLNHPPMTSPSELSHTTTPAHTYTHSRNTPTWALINQWGLTYIKVRLSWLGWVIGLLWGDGEILKTRAWKICCAHGSEKRVGGIPFKLVGGKWGAAKVAEWNIE